MDNGNTPIVMYTRKPGMIVGYDFDGAWTHRMPKSSESEFIIGLFVINSSNTLKNVTNPKTLNPLSMEEYLHSNSTTGACISHANNTGSICSRNLLFCRGIYFRSSLS